MRKIASLILSLMICILSSVQIINASTSYNVDILNNCKKITVDSNNSGAFAYGFKGSIVYSSMLLPNVHNRYVTVEGNIKSVCQNGKYTCALVEKNLKNKLYCIAQMNMENGECKYYDFKNMSSLLAGSFSVSGGKAFFIRTDSAFAYVSSYSINGEHSSNYVFSQNVTELFNNNSNTYARLYDGSVYRLADGKSYYCAHIDRDTLIYNSGSGWVATDSGRLVSLTGDGSRQIGSTEINSVTISKNSLRYLSYSGIALQPVNSDNVKYFNHNNNIKLIASYNDKTAVVENDYDCLVISNSEFKDLSINFNNNNNNGTGDKNLKNTYNDYKISSDGIMYGITSGTNVTDFKKSFSVLVSLKSSSGESVTSGKIKTGQRVTLNNEEYAVAVMGDLTGEGNVKSNDVSKLMGYFVNTYNLSGAYFKAADFNLDGSVNNKDLVLISRKAES